MPDCVPLFKPGAGVTCHNPAAVTGRRFVAISGDFTGGNPTVATAGAGVRTFGVAVQDAEAGRGVAVWSDPGLIVPVDAAGAIAAGAEVSSDPTGQAVTRPGVAPNAPAGTAVSAGAAGGQVFVKLSAGQAGA